MSAEAFIVTDAHPISEHLIKDALLVLNFSFWLITFSLHFTFDVEEGFGSLRDSNALQAAEAVNGYLTALSLNDWIRAHDR